MVADGVEAAEVEMGGVAEVKRDGVAEVVEIDAGEVVEMDADEMVETDADEVDEVEQCRPISSGPPELSGSSISRVQPSVPSSSAPQVPLPFCAFLADAAASPLLPKSSLVPRSISFLLPVWSRGVSTSRGGAAALSHGCADAPSHGRGGAPLRVSDAGAPLHASDAGALFGERFAAGSPSEPLHRAATSAFDFLPFRAPFLPDPLRVARRFAHP